MNLAIEEYLFDNEKSDVFMLWQNDRTVVIGKNQNASVEVDREFAEKNGITVARRITGGGAVYHDLGNLNYSFISSARGKLDFAYFTAPVLEALSALDVEASLSGRNDIVTADGKKISGGAECKRGDRVLHHGTLLFDSDLSVLSRVLLPDPEKLRAKAVPSVRSRVGNVRDYLACDMDISEFTERLAEHILAKYSPEVITVPECERIDELFKRNASFEYIYPEREYLSSYTVVRKKRYEFGTVECLIEMRNDTPISLKILGDFFGSRPVSELEEKITSAMRSEKLSELLCDGSGLCVGDYILGMENRELYSQLLGKE